MSEKYDLIKMAIEARSGHLSEIINELKNSSEPFNIVEDIKKIKKQMNNCLEDISSLVENEFIKEHRNLICISLRFYYYQLGMIKQTSCAQRDKRRKQMEQTIKIGKEVCQGICPDSKEIRDEKCPKIFPNSKEIVDPF